MDLRSKKNNPKNKIFFGFSLIEVMIAIAIMAAMGMGLMALLVSNNNQVLAQRYTATRDNLKMLAERYIANQSFVAKSYAYRASAPPAPTDGNLLLDVCQNSVASLVGVNSTPALTDPACPAGTTYFNFVDPGNPGALFAGTNANPVRYDTNGKVCATASPTCPLELVTSFVSTCSGAPPCAKAATINVQYELRQAATVQLPYSTTLKTMTNLAAISGAGAGFTVKQIINIPVSSGHYSSAPYGAFPPVAPFGNLWWSQTITPSSVNSKIRISVNLAIFGAGALPSCSTMGWGLFRNGTPIDSMLNTVCNNMNLSFEDIDLPATTTPVTYSMYGGDNGWSIYINKDTSGGIYPRSSSLMEYYAP